MNDVSNDDRANLALGALGDFVSTTRVDAARDAIGDLIANLLHLARGRGLDTDQLLANAAAVMAEELAEDEEGDMQAVQRRFRTLLPLDA